MSNNIVSKFNVDDPLFTGSAMPTEVGLLTGAQEQFRPDALLTATE